VKTKLWQLGLGLVPLAALAAVLPGCDGQGTGPTRIRLSLVLGDTSEWYQGAMRWKELVEERTKGRYVVEIIPNSSRSNHSQSQELQDVQGGRLEASLESTILLSTVETKWAVFSYPWLFPSHAIAGAVCGGPMGEEMMELLMDRNIVGLAYGTNGFRQITNSVRPIRKAEDLQGLKIRVPQGLPPQLFEHFGASAHQMNFGDLVVALRTGDMHGQENPLSVIQSTKLFSVQKYVTLWNYVYDPIVLCVNRDFWYRLPGPDQKILRDCAHEAMAFERGLVAEADSTLPAKLEAAGMEAVRLTEVEKDTFRAKAMGLRPVFEEMVGADLLRRLEAAVKDEVEKARLKALEEADEAR